MPQDYFVKLKTIEGGKFVAVRDVVNYVRGTESYRPSKTYRDLDFEYDASVTAVSGVLPDGTAFGAGTKLIRVPDNIEHEPPRQETFERQFHKFTDALDVELGFFWDDYVVCVTNDSNAA